VNHSNNFHALGCATVAWETALKFGERIKIGLISTFGYWTIRIICSTLRWEVIDWQNLEAIENAGKHMILAFWHGRTFLASYYFRSRGIVVMISQNRDGEYIARVIQRFGFGVTRGSSTRGSHGAIMETLRALKMGSDVGFAMDGPRGPRYIVKPGAAYTAWKSGNPVLPFCISADKKWVMRSWDHFQIPKPFSRAVVLIGNPIYVELSAGKEEINVIEAQIQHSLDELRDRGDSWWGGEPDR
jgi:lysophospholipid acyltransferase (LPLAT)-like uncharacterized protein